MSAEANAPLPIPDLGPPRPIEHLYIFHGFTLTPDYPPLWKNTADFAEKGFGIEAHVPALPNTDNPHPEEWEECMRETITDPASSIIVSQSLSGYNALRYISHCKLDDPLWQLAGWIPLASNLGYVGIPEIADHFDSSWGGEMDVGAAFGTFIARTCLASLAVRQIALLYGAYDPFVYPAHGIALGQMLDAPVYIDPDEAHFSGPQSMYGRDIPLCEFNFTLAFLISKMIMNVAPEGRYDLSEGHTLQVDAPFMPSRDHPFPYSPAHWKEALAHEEGRMGGDNKEGDPGPAPEPKQRRPRTHR